MDNFAVAFNRHFFHLFLQWVLSVSVNVLSVFFFFFLSQSSPESDSLVDNVESKNVLTIFSFCDSLMYESCWCDENSITILQSYFSPLPACVPRSS